MFISATTFTVAFMLTQLPLTQNGGQPVQIPDLRSDTIPSKNHPFLFLTPEEVDAARKRIETEPEFRKMFQDLVEQAGKDMETELEDIGAEWWDKEKEKPWQKTYPIIFEKTWLQPNRMITPAHRLARAYLLTGEDKYADRAREILLHLSDYTFEFEHFDVGMNYSVWGYRALEVYDTLFDRFTPEEKEKLDAFFTRFGRAVLANDIYWIDNNIGGGINNHLAWHKMTVGLLGVFYDEEELVEYALHGRRGIGELLERGLIDDGLWCESSLNYHFAAIIPMTLVADVLRRIRHEEDLFTKIFADGRNLKQAYDSMFGVLFPSGLIPPIGDAYAKWRKLSDHSLYEYAFRAYGDSRYVWLLNRSEERAEERTGVKKSEGAGRRSGEALFTGPLPGPGEPPEIGTRLYPEHGYVFLRSVSGAEYWDSDAWCAFLTFDRSGVHTNADKLSLMLFGRGVLLLPDVEAKSTVPHAFSSRVQGELNRGGLSQNTVMIDGRDQAYRSEILSLLEYRDLPGEKRATAADLRGILYPGVRQQRTVCVTEGYVLDVFQVVTDTTKEIEWIIHGPKEVSGESSNLVFAPTDPRTMGAWGWIRDQRKAQTGDDWWTEWETGDVRFRVSVSGEQGTTVRLSGYPATDDPSSPVFPMLTVGRSAGTARFVALYQADREDPERLSILIGEEWEGRFPVTVRGESVVRTHTIPVLEP
jgi:hypothetical protein